MCFQFRPSHLNTRLIHIMLSTMRATWATITSLLDTQSHLTQELSMEATMMDTSNMDIWVDLPAMVDMDLTHTTEDIQDMVATMVTVAMATHGTVLDMVTMDSMAMAETGMDMEILTGEDTLTRAIISRWILTGLLLRWEADRAASLEEDLMIKREADKEVNREAIEVDLEIEMEVDRDAIEVGQEIEKKVNRDAIEVALEIKREADRKLVDLLRPKERNVEIGRQERLTERPRDRLKGSPIPNIITHLMTMDITKMDSQLMTCIMPQDITLPMIHT